MAERATRARAEAIEGFASLLRDLRQSVGNPSFREMSGRSRAISHTTLHEAAQGHRLPSWATTVEFVKACGSADPGEYRARWEQATRVVRSVSSRGPATPRTAVPRPSAGLAPPAAGLAGRRAIHLAIDAEPAPSPPAHGASANEAMPIPDVAVDGVAADDAASVAPTPPRGRRRLRLAAQVVTGVGVVAVVVVVVAGNLVTESVGKPQIETGRTVQTQFSPADCPVRQYNPPAALPAHQGDASEFIADLTLADCSHVRHGQTVVKVWRIKNVGTVPWIGYSLHRLAPPQKRDQCQTISDVPVNDTQPGDLVDIRTEITAPQTAGFCFVRFKMVDVDGIVAFPGRRPVNFQIIVD